MSGITKKILVVDNHPMILKLMSNILEKEGHEVMTASDGLAALNVLEVFAPDIIFLDLVMPNISGDKLCRIIRGMPQFKNVFIVILSALVGEEEIDCQAIGADACLAKSTAKSIQRLVMDIINKKSPRFSQPPIVNIDDTRCQNITRELLSSKRHFETIVNNMSEGVFELNLEGKIIYANPKAISLCVTEEENILAKYFKDLFSQEEREVVDRLLRTKKNITPAFEEEFIPVKLHKKYVALNFLDVIHDNEKTILAIATDITKRREAEAALLSSENRFRELFDHMSSGVLVYEAKDIDGNDFIIIDANHAAGKIENIQKEKIIGRNLLDIFPWAKDSGLYDLLHRAWHSGHPEDQSLSIKDNGLVIGWREYYIYRLPSGEMVSIFEDVTAQKHAETELAFESAINEAVAQASKMIISSDSLDAISKKLMEEAQKLTKSKFGLVGNINQLTGDLEATALTTNIAGECEYADKPIIFHQPKGLFGWVLKNKEGLYVNSLSDDKRSYSTPEGHVPIENFLAAPAMIDDTLTGVIAVANRDGDYEKKDLATVEQFASLYAMAVQKHRAEEHISHIAHHDQLTGLINRHLFPDRLAQAMVLAKRHNKKAALLYVDLDRFKQINDNFGHQAGDAVLKEVSRRIKATIRGSDTVARMGGDEFVIIIHDVTKKTDPADVAQKVLKALIDPITYKDKCFEIMVSIGISIYPDDDKNIESLLHKADKAMYRAKKTMGNNYCFYAD